MDALREKQDEITDALDKVEKELDGLSKKEPSQRGKAFPKIEKLLDKAKGLIETYEYDKLELAASSVLSGSMSFDDHQKDYEKRHADLNKRFLFQKDPNAAYLLYEKDAEGSVFNDNSKHKISLFVSLT